MPIRNNKKLTRRRYVPLDPGNLFLRVGQPDYLEELRLVLGPEHAARDFAEELLQHRRYRVDREAVDVDKPPILEEVHQLSHVALVAGGAEHVLLERTLLVELEEHHLCAHEGSVKL